MEENSKAKGGHARAKALMPEQRQEIARKAAEARWTGNFPRVTHRGKLQIGDVEIPCFVLDDGRRVISGRGMTAAIGMKGRGQGIARIATHKILKTNANNNLIMAIENPIRFSGGSPRPGVPSSGYEATVLQELCEAILQARDKSELKTEQDLRYGAFADMLIRAFARVGIIALVDEATGYQEVRDRKALQEILNRYIGQELAKWVSTFPQEFYKEIFRLRKWNFNPASTKRPVLMANITIDLVYRRLAPGVLTKLRELTPKDEHGRRKNKLFQWLSEDVGHPALKEHLSGLIFLAKSQDEWQGFVRAVDRAAPRFGDTLPLPLPDEKAISDFSASEQQQLS